MMKNIFLCFILWFVAGNVSFVNADSSLENEYIIRAEDGVEIFVWQNAELSRRTEVQMDGQIYLPLIGHMSVIGMTPKQLEKEVAKRFSEYVKDPQVSVIMTKFADRVVYVLGEVKNPGKYTLFKDLKLRELVSMAGSFTDNAVLGKVKILRRVGGKMEVIKPDMEKVMSGEEEDVMLQIGDTIYVPRSKMAEWNAFLNKINPSISFIFTVAALLALIFVKTP